jgi:hypothetical protein
MLVSHPHKNVVTEHIVVQVINSPASRHGDLGSVLEEKPCGVCGGHSHSGTSVPLSTFFLPSSLIVSLSSQCVHCCILFCHVGLLQ